MKIKEQIAKRQYKVFRDNCMSAQISIMSVHLVNNSYSRLQCDLWLNNRRAVDPVRMFTSLKLNLIA